MASPVVSIPGRHVNFGEVFYTDWAPRGGDCFTMIAECLVAATAGTIVVTAETRGEDGTFATSVANTIGNCDISAAGLYTAICLATTSSSAGNGAQEQVRIKIDYAEEGSPGDYAVIRIFPLAFFDSAKPY